MNQKINFTNTLCFFCQWLFSWRSITSFILVFIVIGWPFSANAQSAPPCSTAPFWIKKACIRVHQMLYEGKVEGYLTLYAWHNRYMYTKEKMRTTIYNEEAWGGGLGKGFFDEDGDYHGLYAFAFLDSHKKVEPVTGYAFLKMAKLDANTRIGAGYSLLLTMRPDIFHGNPFPGAVPWVSITHKQATLSAVYIPGGRNIGNVLFVFAKWQFDIV